MQWQYSGGSGVEGGKVNPQYEYHGSAQQGAGGRWRFFIHRVSRSLLDKERIFWATSGVRDFATEQEARKACEDMKHGEWYWEH